jgi:hypothetical protein
VASIKTSFHDDGALRRVRVVFAHERIAAWIEWSEPHGAFVAAADHFLDLERGGIEFLGRASSFLMLSTAGFPAGTWISEGVNRWSLIVTSIAVCAPAHVVLEKYAQVIRSSTAARRCLQRISPSPCSDR